MTHLDDIPDKITAVAIWKYFPPILLVLGTVGNILSIIVVTRKQVWKLSSSIYIVALALSDIVVLYAGLLTNWLRRNYDSDIRLHSVAACKIVPFLIVLSFYYSSWIVTSFSLERFISIRFPLKFRMISSRRNTMIALAIMLFLLALLTAHFLYGYDLQLDHDGFYCGYCRENCTMNAWNYNKFYRHIWQWIDMAVFSFVPFIIITMCNVSILVTMARRRNTAVQRSSTEEDAGKQRALVILMVTLSAAFVINTMPGSIVLVAQPFLQINASNNDVARIHLVWAVTSMFTYLNNCINFALYVASGKTFRNAFLGLFIRNMPRKEADLSGKQLAPVSQQLPPKVEVTLLESTVDGIL